MLLRQTFADINGAPLDKIDCFSLGFLLPNFHLLPLPLLPLLLGLEDLLLQLGITDDRTLSIVNTTLHRSAIAPTKHFRLFKDFTFVVSHEASLLRRTDHVGDLR